MCDIKIRNIELCASGVTVFEAWESSNGSYYYVGTFTCSLKRGRKASKQMCLDTYLEWDLRRAECEAYPELECV